MAHTIAEPLKRIVPGVRDFLSLSVAATVGPAWQTVTFALCAAFAFALQTLLALDLISQLLVLGVLVAIVGLPHGGLDLPIAEALWPLRGWRGKLRFLAIYLGLVGCVIASWALLPGVALAAFLTYSMVHFSGDWSRAEASLRWSGGVAVIGAPAVTHTQEVTEIFAHLAPLQAAHVNATMAAIAGSVALGVLVLTLVTRPSARGQAAAEQIVLWTTALLLPPLIFLIVYFCGLHSIRHFHTAIRSVDNARRALVISVGLSGVVTLTAVAFVLSSLNSGLQLRADAPLQAISVGLAALTVPHMLLVERFQRQSSV